jgi:asparaginyl-tRNA synthetase
VTEPTRIRDLAAHVGQEVRVAGWVFNQRSKGKISFIQLRDGSARVQCVAVQGECDEAAFQALGTLKMEASVVIFGTVRDEQRAPTGVELTVATLEVLHNPQADYPIAKKEHGIDFLLEHRHLWLRSPRQEALLRVRHGAASALRRFYDERGFVQIDTPILTGAVGESHSSLFTLPYFDLGDAYLAQTGQLYLEAACAAFGSVYNFGPTFRAEKSKTRRHLTEFWMLEAEVAFMDQEASLQLQEQMVSAVVEHTLGAHGAELALLGRDLAPLAAIKTPFPRLDYGEAIVRLQQLGSSIEWGKDLGAEDETLLSSQFDQPLFVVNYPREVKPFYMKANAADPRTVLCADLLAPEGYGELIGGSQREDDYDALLGRIREEKLPEESYRWYLELREFGSVVHSGFGIGLERTVTWLTGSHHVRETIPFPRTLSRIYP